MRAVVVSGHMIDAPDRAVPRFPSSSQARVRREIDQQLARWSVGAGDVIICGGARGADLIAADAGLDRSAAVWLCLALPRDEFVARSVDLADTDWRRRFETIETHAELFQLETGPSTSSVFERANDWMIDLALRCDDSDTGPHALVVWDGAPSASPGGVAHMAQQLARHGIEPVVIDPTPADPAKPAVRPRPT